MYKRQVLGRIQTGDGYTLLAGLMITLDDPPPPLVGSFSPEFTERLRCIFFLPRYMAGDNPLPAYSGRSDPITDDDLFIRAEDLREVTFARGNENLALDWAVGMQQMPWPLRNTGEHTPLSAGYIAGEYYHILSAYGVQAERPFQGEVLAAAPGLIPPAMHVYALLFTPGP